MKSCLISLFREVILIFSRIGYQDRSKAVFPIAQQLTGCSKIDSTVNCIKLNMDIMSTYFSGIMLYGKKI